jgi:hypothetical protein
LKDLLFKVAELYYLQTKKISPVPDSCAVSSSALSTNSSVPSPLIARQLQESPVASPPAALSIEKIACLEFLAFMLLSLPGKSYCLQQEFIMTRTSGPPSKGLVANRKRIKKRRRQEFIDSDDNGPSRGGVRFAHSLKSWAPHAPHAWHHVSAQHVCHLRTSPQSTLSAPSRCMPQLPLARSPCKLLHLQETAVTKPHRIKTCDKKEETQKNVHTMQ